MEQPEGRLRVAIYGVHRKEWNSVGEIELLTGDRAKAEDHAMRASADWVYGKLVVTRRELDQNGVYVISVWRRGEKVADHGSRGRWRKVQENPC